MSEVLKTANRFAWAAGLDPGASRITIAPHVSEEGVSIWRVTYGTIGHEPGTQRGGGLIVEVVAEDGSLYRILHGQ